MQEKRYDSSDDFMILGVLERANLKEKYFNIYGVINFLFDRNIKMLLRITVELIEKRDEKYIVELNTSLRFRIPSML